QNLDLARKPCRQCHAGLQRIIGENARHALSYLWPLASSVRPPSVAARGFFHLQVLHFIAEPL
ncbi:hypothetical protein, partial [Staphylococcus aureus]|uniref:hypothetical protein n=1 Tax=Staphylococcus aureus TaxID=1280 RepID=UPI003D100205